MRLPLIVIVAALSFGSSLNAQSVKTSQLLLTPSKSQAPTSLHKRTQVPHESFSPYWSAEPGWHTNFQLRNNLAESPLTVTPILHLSDGRGITLSPVALEPTTAVSIDVRRELFHVAPELVDKVGTFGSVSFLYTSLTAKNLYAYVMIHMDGQPIGYHVDAFPLGRNSPAGSREGIWWLPRPETKDFLVVSNGAEKPVNGILSLYDATGKESQMPIDLGAYQSKRFVVSELVRSAGLSGSYGGIRFAVPHSAGAVDSVHFTYDVTAGFSALMKMFDRDPVAKLEQRLRAGNKQWTLWAPMLPLRSPDPAIGFPAGTVLEPTIFLRNTTPKTLDVAMNLTWRGDSAKGKTAPKLMTLEPFETLRLNIGAMQSELSIPDEAHWALVTLTTRSSPDDFMAVAASYDPTGRYGAQTPFSDQISGHWVGGLWQVDSTHNSILAVTNAGTRETDALLTLFFNEGNQQQRYEIQQTIPLVSNCG